MTGVDGVNQVILNLYRNLCLGCLHLFHDNLDTLRLNELELIIERLFPVLSQFLHRSHILLGQGEDCLSLEGDSVTHVATVPYCQTGIQFLNGFAHHLCHQLVGIAAPLVNLQSGVSTAQVLYSQAYGCIVSIRLHLFIVQCSGNIDTTGTSDDELTPVL